MDRFRKVLIIILLLVIAACVGYIVHDYIRKQQNGRVYEELQKEQKIEEEKEEVQQDSEKKVEIPIDFAALQAQNPDIYAWIRIDGTNINYPVVQSASDNEYYLNHTIDGQEGYPGSIYTENYNKKDFTDYNTIIYGHDMKDGSMFQNLHNYMDPAYMQAHPEVIIYTPDVKRTYRIFAAVVYDNRHLLFGFDFTTPEGRQSFLDSLRASRDLSNVFREDVAVSAQDRLLTLSTCMTGQDEKRFLVEAVLVDEEK